MIPALIEAALRAILVALVVAVGLRFFRVRNVLAQKAAWGLVLAAALAMPLAMRWQGLPPSVAIRLHAPTWGKTQPAPDVLAVPDSLPAGPHSPAHALEQAAGDRFPAPIHSSSKFNPPAQAPPPQVQPELAPSPVTTPGPWAALRFLQPASFAWLLYCAVSAALLFRLFYGLASAARIWLAAEPITLEPWLNSDPKFRVRSSAAVASPVTIGSGIVLPADYGEWSADKLRIVLAHERSHIRQADFYLQVLSGLYTALFWFSPLGWWLRRTLSDLGEAISDYAGLEEAASRTSYAQLLLEFAALPRPTLIGVAMARSSNLPRRIERLLNDSIFRQAFAGSRRTLLAVLLVPVALFAGTALIRVEAAGQAAQQTPPAAPQDPLTGVSNPDQDTGAPYRVQAMPPAPRTPAAPVPPVGPSSDSIPGDTPAVPVPPEPPTLDSNSMVIIGRGHSISIASPSSSIHTSVHVDANVHTNMRANMIASADGVGMSQSSGHGYSYSYSSNGDSWALVTEPGEHISFSGEWGDDTRGKLDKARKLAHGKFLWFTRDGKSYFIDDPDLVTQIQAMYLPMEALGKLQEALGRQQEALGKKQEELGDRQEKVSIPTPDLSRQMAALDAATAKLKAKVGSTIGTEELATIEAEIAEIQAQLGAMQGVIAAKQGDYGSMQGKLGAEQGEIGAQQGRIGEKQGKLAAEADRKVRAMINESLHNGKAHPVE